MKCQINYPLNPKKLCSSLFNIIVIGSILIYFSDTYHIPLKYHPEMWDVSTDALSGNPGLYTHVSYRKDKSDCFPQEELIQLLQWLEKN